MEVAAEAAVQLCHWLWLGAAAEAVMRDPGVGAAASLGLVVLLCRRQLRLRCWRHRWWCCCQCHGALRLAADRVVPLTCVAQPSQLCWGQAAAAQGEVLRRAVVWHRWRVSGPVAEAVAGVVSVTATATAVATAAGAAWA